ncbi:hypothetical protein [Enterobacter roggenkampii]|uniref:hypothetical protein n=1 Tax=Enterobacter roggenkampii TaxID=1812935 RepID=UPI00195532C1|nr:hypothetical protein [Enterobacter roggenkampii]
MKAHSSFTDGDRFVNWRSALPVVVNAQADALAAKVYLLQRNLMRVKLAIRQSVSHRNEGKSDNI